MWQSFATKIQTESPLMNHMSLFRVGPEFPSVPVCQKWQEPRWAWSTGLQILSWGLVRGAGLSLSLSSSAHFCLWPGIWPWTSHFILVGYPVFIGRFGVKALQNRQDQLWEHSWGRVAWCWDYRGKQMPVPFPWRLSYQAVLHPENPPLPLLIPRSSLPSLLPVHCPLPDFELESSWEEHIDAVCERERPSQSPWLGASGQLWKQPCTVSQGVWTSSPFKKGLKASLSYSSDPPPFPGSESKLALGFLWPLVSHSEASHKERCLLTQTHVFLVCSVALADVLQHSMGSPIRTVTLPSMCLHPAPPGSREPSSLASGLTRS